MKGMNQGKGWREESMRHAMAAKGIKSGVNIKHNPNKPEGYKDYATPSQRHKQQDMKKLKETHDDMGLESDEGYYDRRNVKNRQEFAIAYANTLYKKIERKEELWPHEEAWLTQHRLTG